MADGMCQRKNKITALTMIISSSRSCFRLSMDCWINSDGSIRRHDRDALRQRRLQLRQLRFHGLDDMERVFSMAHTTIPPTTSPLPSRSAIPRRICGPSAMVATSRSKTSVPAGFDFHTNSPQRPDVLNVAAGPDHEFFTVPLIVRPPTSLLFLRIAAITSSTGRPEAWSFTG